MASKLQIRYKNQLYNKTKSNGWSCETCDRAFCLEEGLKQHIARNANRPCGIFAFVQKRQKQIAFFAERRKAVMSENIENLGPMNNLSKKSRGPLTTADKETILRIFDVKMMECNFKRTKAVKETSKTFGRTIPLVRSVIKEKLIFGNVIGGPYKRIKKSFFDNLTIKQRDIIRSAVHNEIRKCLDKVEGTQYPTTDSIHAALMSREDLPKWSRTATFRILKLLRFECKENHEIHFGLLIENDFITETRKKTCQLIKKLIKEGYYLLFFDESYVNVHYRRKRNWQDMTLRTTQEARDQGYTTGVNKPPGRGERLILIGAGGSDGWEHWEVTKRSKCKGNAMDYKQNMDGARFEKFLETACVKVKKRHDKVAAILDNASVHNVYRNDIPRQGHPGWNVKNLKEFCEKKKLKVSAIHSKSSQKKPILKDYKDAIDKYKENSDCKFRADEIMNKHGIIPIRLPPYHPELNAIERI